MEEIRSIQEKWRPPAAYESSLVELTENEAFRIQRFERLVDWQRARKPNSTLHCTKDLTVSKLLLTLFA